jgi:hypothetical protein
MKFTEKINYYNQILFEQDDAIQPPAPGPGQNPTEPAQMPADTEQAGAEEPLPESNVLLVRLLIKALVMDIDPEDISEIKGMGDVNENNASEILDRLITIMKNYSADIDIET